MLIGEGLGGLPIRRDVRRRAPAVASTAPSTCSPVVSGALSITSRSPDRGTYVDLERARELRERSDGVDSSLHEAANAGLLTQRERPELRDRFFPEEAPSGCVKPAHPCGSWQRLSSPARQR
jgi:hypothetical protein